MRFLKKVARKILVDELAELIEDNERLQSELNNCEKDDIMFSSNYEKKIKDIDSLNIILSTGGSIRIMDIDGVLDLIRNNTSIKIYFVFDWESYRSKIIIEGINNKQRIELDIPQIPLLGGVMSNYVSNRLVIGQVFVSSMLECVRLHIDYLANERYAKEVETKVIKIDRCFYAPFLTYRDKEENIKYQPILEEKYPEALEVVKNLKEGENYWKVYHDNH